VREHWHPAASGRRGAPFLYSDLAIQVLLTLKAVFSLAYRALEGFAGSLIRLTGLNLPVPDHTQRSRRSRTLRVAIPRRERSGPLHVVVDATGLKVFGEGECKVRQHGVGKRRTGLKVHLAVDADAKDVIAVEVTTPAWGDSEVFGGLLDQVEGRIGQVDGDGVYDTREVYTAGQARAWWSRRGTTPCPGRRGISARGRWPTSPGRGWRDGRRRPATLAAAWPRTPCTASSSCSAAPWLPAFSRRR